jgi:hypothetical protein
LSRLYTQRDVAVGLVIYAAGDSAAALLRNQYSVGRMLGVMLAGALVYSLEVPRWFRWIDRRTANLSGVVRAVSRTGLALLYFNPLWIARHLLLLHAFSQEWDAIAWSLLRTGALSWLVNVPLALLGNFVVQTLVPLRYRFFGSALFSALMAVYYAWWK